MTRYRDAGDPDTVGVPGPPDDLFPPSWGSGLAWLRPPLGSDVPLAGPPEPPSPVEAPAGVSTPVAVGASGRVGAAGSADPVDPRDPGGLLVGDGAAVLAGGVATWLPEGRWVAAGDPAAPPAEPIARRGAGRAGWRVSLARLGARAAGWPRRVLVVALLAAAALIGLRPDPPLAPVAPAVPTTRIVVAAHDLPAGRVLVAADLRTVPVPTAVVPSHAVRAAATLVGRVAAGPMRRGEAVTDARVMGPGLTAGLTAGEATAVPVRLADPETAALVRPGDRIDVLGVPVEPAGGPPPAGDGDAVAVASDVRVLAVLGARDPVDGVVVVVAATEQVARRLAGGAMRHRLTVAVRPP